MAVLHTDTESPCQRGQAIQEPALPVTGLLTDPSSAATALLFLQTTLDQSGQRHWPAKHEVPGKGLKTDL